MMTFKNLPKFSRWLIVGCCACWLSVGIGLAQAASPFYWDFINVDIALQTDGDMLITETQKYTFTADHTNQRYRYIPLAGIDQITDVSVSEGDEQLPTQTGIEKNQYWIRWRHDLSAPASHTFKIQYRVVGAVQTQGDTSQILWRSLFPERSADIQQGQVTVHLPDELAGKVNQFRSHGVTATHQQIDDQTFEFVVSEPLAPQKFLDVNVRFPTGVLDIEATPGRSESAPEPDAAIAYTPPPQNASQDIWGPIVGWCAFMAIGSLILWGIYVSQPTCLNCGKRGARRINRVIRPATTQRKGEREVGYTCWHCNYHRTHREAIPKRTTSSGSRSYGSGYSGGGGYGGGGSCGGGGTGGGCGGGGASGGGGGG